MSETKECGGDETYLSKLMLPSFDALKLIMMNSANVARQSKAAPSKNAILEM